MSAWQAFGALQWMPATTMQATSAGAEKLFVKLEGGTKRLAHVAKGVQRVDALRAIQKKLLEEREKGESGEQPLLPPAPLPRKRTITAASSLPTVPPMQVLKAPAKPEARELRPPKNVPAKPQACELQPPKTAEKSRKKLKVVPTFEVGAYVRHSSKQLPDERKGVFEVVKAYPSGTYTLRSLGSRVLRRGVDGGDLRRSAQHAGGFGPPRRPGPAELRRAGQQAVEQKFGVSAATWRAAARKLEPRAAHASIGRHDLRMRPGGDPARPGDASCGGSLVLPTLRIGKTGGCEDDGRIGKIPVIVLGHAGCVMFNASIKHATALNHPTSERTHPAHPSIVAQTADSLLGLSSSQRADIDADLWRCKALDLLAHDAKWRHAAFIPVSQDEVPEGVDNNVQYNEEKMRFIVEKLAVLFDAATGEPLLLYEAEKYHEIAGVMTEHFAPLAKVRGWKVRPRRGKPPVKTAMPPITEDESYDRSEHLFFNATRSEGCLRADDQRMMFVGSHSEVTNAAYRGSAPNGGAYGRRLINADDSADLTHYAEMLRAPNYWLFSMSKARRPAAPPRPRAAAPPAPPRPPCTAASLCLLTNRSSRAQPLYEPLSEAYHASSPRCAAYMVGMLALVDTGRRAGSDVGVFMTRDRLISFVAPTSGYDSGVHADPHDVGWTLAIAAKCPPPGYTPRPCGCDERGCEAALFDPSVSGARWARENSALAPGVRNGIRVLNDIRSARGRLHWGAGRRPTAACRARSCRRLRF